MASRLQQRIRKKMVRAEEKLKAANTMLENGVYEDAISRAYYAMYHTAKALLLTKQIEPKSHKGVTATFSQHFVNTGIINRSYAKMLSHAKDFRENSDYEEEYEATKEEAVDIIQDAVQFVAKIKEIIAHPRPQKNLRCKSFGKTNSYVTTI